MITKDFFLKNRPIIGMIHTLGLPGTPKNKATVTQIIDQALKELEIYKGAGIDAVMIENMHDIPYLKRVVGPEITATMTVICQEVRRQYKGPLGLQILAGANKDALAVSLATGLDFIRAEGFVFAHVGDEGIIESDAGELLRYRKAIGAEHILVFNDIKKKHSAHSITADVDIVETAHAAEFFLSDGVIVTGASTGKEASLDEVKAVKKHSPLPVMVGSGVNLENVERYLPHADGIVVGSYFKKDGQWDNEMDPERVKRFMDKVRTLRA